MLRPRLRAVSAVALFTVAALAALGSLGGCGRLACFEWSGAQGPCPSKQEALGLFGFSSCDGPYESLDGEASFDGELCCYPATPRRGVPTGDCYF